MDKIQGDFVDWGKTIGDGNTWRTPSNDERINDMTFDNASIDVNWYSTAKTGFSVRLVIRASTF